MMDLSYLKELLEQIQVDLSQKQFNQFIQYYEMLIKKNEVMNLTAITEWKEVILKHFVDSLSLKQFYNLTDQRVADLGTGAGFPGIPLKIAFPDLEIVLIDSLNKRVKFLNEVIEALCLEKITAIHGRAEDIGRSVEYRESFDLCVSRAVANLSTLSEYCLPLVKVGGMFIAYKAGNLKEELERGKNAFFKLGGKLNKVQAFELPETDIHRNFVFIEKKNKMSKAYPRTAGKPAKEPL
jgi:16S rRNA (guanine527-N7)-methyltransferase